MRYVDDIRLLSSCFDMEYKFQFIYGKE